MAETTVAMLGLGTMGLGMAQNLLKAGFSLAVYNRTAAKAQPLAAKGARVATSAADAVKGAEVVVAMVSDDGASREMWIGAQGALVAAEPGAVLVESSTLSPGWVEELGAAARARGLELLDAPVTGSRPQAEAGQITFLVGGSEEALRVATPVLAAMGKEVVHLGPLGSGARMKLVNNFLAGVQVASLAEAIVWLERSGLDRDKAIEILKKGAPGSPLFGTMSARMTEREYEVNFLLRLMSKDLAYAGAAAREAGVDLTMARAAEEMFERAGAAGYAEMDMSAVIEPLRGAGAGR